MLITAAYVRATMAIGGGERRRKGGGVVGMDRMVAAHSPETRGQLVGF